MVCLHQTLPGNGFQQYRSFRSRACGVAGWLPSHNSQLVFNCRISNITIDLLPMTVRSLAITGPHCLAPSAGWSVKLLLAYASTVIPGFSLFEIHDQDFYSLLDMYKFRNGASSSTKEGSVFRCRRYVSCIAISRRVYPRCHGVQVSMDSVYPLSLHHTK
jgi:hypothetical protein